MIFCIFLGADKWSINVSPYLKLEVKRALRLPIDSVFIASTIKSFVI